MKIDSVSNLSFPVTRPEESIFKKPDLTSDNYISCQPVKDEFIKEEKYDPIEALRIEKEEAQKYWNELVNKPQRFQQ